MIRNFRDREEERIFNREFSRKLPQEIQQRAFRKLGMLNRAASLDTWRIPRLTGWENFMGEDADK